MSETSFHLDSLPDAPRLMIRPRSNWFVDLRELWRYRDLLWMLGLRDIQVRYKQTVLGVLWAVIQPVVTMVVFTIFFGRLLGVPRMDEPVFVYAGVLPWTFFAATVTAAANSLVSNAAIVQKIYFPRLLVPVAAAGAPLVDYAVALAVLVGLMVWFGVGLTAQFLLLPALIMTTVVAALAVGIVLAGLTVSYRDFRYVVPFMIQVWFFLTPVLYPQTVMPERFRWLASLNPMAGTIEAFRGAVLGTPIDYVAWAVSAGVAVALLLAGLAYFGHVEHRFADVV